MKKFYSILALSLIVLLASCSKKSDPKPDKDQDEDVATTILGRWELTKRMVTLYQDGKLVDSVDEADHDDPAVVTFRLDGTGKESNSKYDLAVFTYTANKEGVTYHEYTRYEPGTTEGFNSGPFTEKFKSFTADKMVFYEDDSFDSQGSKFRSIIEETYVKVK